MAAKVGVAVRLRQPDVGWVPIFYIPVTLKSRY